MPGAGDNPFWLLNFPSTPDHRNAAPKTYIEPHPSPFLIWSSAAALTLYTEAALSTQNQHFSRGTALEHFITAVCPGMFLTKVWEQCGEGEGGSLLWFLPFSYLWLLLSMASFPLLSFMPLNLATLIGTFNCANLLAGASPFCQINKWCIILLHGMKIPAFTHFHCIHSISGETCPE